MLALNTSLPKCRTVMQFGMFRAIWCHSENASSCFRFICSLVQSHYDDDVNICHLRLLAANRVHLKKWISITFSNYFFFQRTKSPLLGFQFSILRLDRRQETNKMKVLYMPFSPLIFPVSFKNVFQ